VSALEDLLGSIEASRGLVIDTLDPESPEIYVFLMDRFAHTDVSSDLVFQFVFRSFYRLDSAGLTKAFKYEYFAALQRLRASSTIDIETVATHFHAFPRLKGDNTLQFSFVTKLAHTIDPSAPIFDNEVAQVFGFRRPASGTFTERLHGHLEFHTWLRSTYQTVIAKGLLARTIDLFRQQFARQARVIGETKTLDFIFWSAGKLIKRQKLPTAPGKSFHLTPRLVPFGRSGRRR
jgi:hypothetical protein